jgi:hypothetical protein
MEMSPSGREHGDIDVGDHIRPHVGVLEMWGKGKKRVRITPGAAQTLDGGRRKVQTSVQLHPSLSGQSKMDVFQATLAGLLSPCAHAATLSFGRSISLTHGCMLVCGSRLMSEKCNCQRFTTRPLTFWTTIRVALDSSTSTSGSTYRADFLASSHLIREAGLAGAK